MKKTLNHCGFTFIELIIAIAILAITLSISGPALGQYSKNQRVKNAAREIYTKLQLARITAIKENNNITATFALDGPPFMSLQREDHSNVIPGVYFDEEYSKILLASTRRIEYGGGVITFSPIGTVDGKSSQTISVRYDDQDIITTYNVVVGSSGGIRFGKAKE